MNQRQRRRNSLWGKDPHCAICGIETIPSSVLNAKYGTNQKLWPRDEKAKMATLDHIYNRWERPMVKYGATRLACFLCNSKRGVADAKAYMNQRAREMRRQPEPRNWLRIFAPSKRFVVMLCRTALLVVAWRVCVKWERWDILAILLGIWLADLILENFYWEDVDERVTEALDDVRGQERP